MYQYTLLNYTDLFNNDITKIRERNNDEIHGGDSKDFNIGFNQDFNYCT